MGRYYKACCDERRESIDPGSIDDLGCKAGPIANRVHSFGAVLVFAMLTRWQSPVRLANDEVGDDPGWFDYVDVTAEVLQAYNAHYGTQIEFTGDSQC